MTCQRCGEENCQHCPICGEENCRSHGDYPPGMDLPSKCAWCGDQHGGHLTTCAVYNGHVSFKQYSGQISRATKDADSDHDDADIGPERYSGEHADIERISEECLGLKTKEDFQRLIAKLMHRFSWLNHDLEQMEEKLKQQPSLRYEGVFEQGKAYGRGSFVTKAGSLWHANKDTIVEPGLNDDWTLAVKRGRDARSR